MQISTDTRRFMAILLISALLAWGMSLPRRARLTPAARPQTAPEATPDLSAFPWLYLRDGQIPEEGEALVEVAAVGDILLGRGVAQEAEPFAKVEGWLQGADLALGNLEGVIAPAGQGLPAGQEAADGPYLLLAPAAGVYKLQKAGFDVLSLANNHALDGGAQGLRQTIAALHSAGMEVSGAGGSLPAAYRPVLRQVKGLRLAFLSFTTIPALTNGAAGCLCPGYPEEGPKLTWQPAAWNQQKALEAVRAARQEADIVIVSMHWGVEYALQASPTQGEMAAALVEAGADFVAGHHPHVVQGTQVFPPDGAGRTGFAAYSLGNFVFDQYGDVTSQGLALRVFFDRDGLRGVQALPLRSGAQPRLMGAEEMEPLIERSRPPAEILLAACDQKGCEFGQEEGAHRAPQQEAGRSGIFWSGWIDLTGDGKPELIRRQAEQAVVTQDDREVWRSPPGWQVLDLALGDPNDDGRYEMLLALRKPDASGALRSHPFIIGYRGGEYRDVWGGSAVGVPILAVELGDLDGDGMQELVVLEEGSAPGQRTVAVWDWNGWGFSLLWRSAPGAYSSVAVVEQVEALPVIVVARSWGNLRP